jgi:hypothetical protein
VRSGVGVDSSSVSINSIGALKLAADIEGLTAGSNEQRGSSIKTRKSKTAFGLLTFVFIHIMSLIICC